MSFRIDINGEIIRDNQNQATAPNPGPEERHFNFLWIALVLIVVFIGYKVISNLIGKNDYRNSRQTTSTQSPGNSPYLQPSTSNSTFSSSAENQNGVEDHKVIILNGKWVQIEEANHGTRNIGLAILFQENIGTVIYVPNSSSPYHAGQVIWKDFDPERQWIKQYITTSDNYLNIEIKFKDSNTIDLYGNIFRRQPSPESETTQAVTPYPDKEKIEADLLGKKMTNWNFDYLQEFQDFNILHEEISDGYLYQTIELKLVDLNTSNNYNSEIVVTYLNANNGWEFVSVKQNSYSQIPASTPPVENGTNQDNAPVSVTPSAPERSSSNKDKSSVPSTSNNFSGHYSGIIFNKGYTNIGDYIYYRTNNCSVDDVFFMDRNDNKVSGNIVNEGQPIYLSMTLGKFTKRSEKFRYSISSYMEDEEGTVYAKSENVVSESSTPYLGIAIGGGLRRLPVNTRSLNIYISFRIDDKFSDAKLEGFYKIVVVR